MLNLDKREFLCFKQDGAITSFNGKPLKLVVKITYLGSSISSIQCDVNIHIQKELLQAGYSPYGKNYLTDQIEQKIIPLSYQHLCRVALRGLQ